MKDSTKSALIVGGVVAGIGLLAYATTAKASPTAAPTPPALPAPPALPPGFNVQQGQSYQLQVQTSGPFPNRDVLVSDLIGQGWVVEQGGTWTLVKDLSNQGGGLAGWILTLFAVWAGPSGAISGTVSSRLKIINMSLGPSRGEIIPLAPGILPSWFHPTVTSGNRRSY